MLTTFLLHVFGEWNVENYRPEPETTSSLSLNNKCAMFGDMHLLRPENNVSALSDDIDGIELPASFLNFFDRHVVAMIVLALALGGIIFSLAAQ